MLYVSHSEQDEQEDGSSSHYGHGGQRRCPVGLWELTQGVINYSVSQWILCMAVCVCCLVP